LSSILKLQERDSDTTTSPPTVNDSNSLTPHDNDQWEPLHYPTLMELLDEFSNDLMSNFRSWGMSTAEVNIPTYPSPPPPPIPPPPISLFQPFEHYLRDTRPCQHRLYCTEGSVIGFYNMDFGLPPKCVEIGMTSVAWCDRITDIHNFRHA
jgi:hypothetical protein